MTNEDFMDDESHQHQHQEHDEGVPPGLAVSASRSFSPSTSTTFDGGSDPDGDSGDDGDNDEDEDGCRSVSYLAWARSDEYSKISQRIRFDDKGEKGYWFRRLRCSFVASTFNTLWRWHRSLSSSDSSSSSSPYRIKQTIIMVVNFAFIIVCAANLYLSITSHSTLQPQLQTQYPRFLSHSINNDNKSLEGMTTCPLESVDLDNDSNDNVDGRINDRRTTLTAIRTIIADSIVWLRYHTGTVHPTNSMVMNRSKRDLNLDESKHQFDHQTQLLQRLSEELLKDGDSEDNFIYRSSLVPWGGPSSKESYDWYSSNDGGRNLLYGYLRLMKWPADLRTSLPSTFCNHHSRRRHHQQQQSYGTCGHAKDVIYRSLEFRESYKPWIVTKSMMASNAHGSIFYHGFSPSVCDMNCERDVRRDAHGNDEQDNERIRKFGNAIVWIRPAVSVHVDDISTIRTAINVLDRAVAASLQRSGGLVGKFNAVFDMKGLAWKSIPSMDCIKTALTIMNEHFVDRLGSVLILNMSHVGEFILQLIRPLLSPEVRNKIVIVPTRDTKERDKILSSVLGSHNIPAWLGGHDTYEFSLTDFYSDQGIIWDTDEKNFSGLLLAH